MTLKSTSAVWQTVPSIVLKPAHVCLTLTYALATDDQQMQVVNDAATSDRLGIQLADLEA